MSAGPDRKFHYLPGEILDLIFSYVSLEVDQDLRVKTLGSASQVSRLWYMVSREYLYRVLMIDGFPGQLTLLVRTLKKNTVLLDYIRELRSTPGRKIGQICRIVLSANDLAWLFQNCEKVVNISLNLGNVTLTSLEGFSSLFDYTFEETDVCDENLPIDLDDDTIIQYDIEDLYATEDEYSLPLPEHCSFQAGIDMLFMVLGNNEKLMSSIKTLSLSHLPDKMEHEDSHVTRTPMKDFDPALPRRAYATMQMSPSFFSTSAHLVLHKASDLEELSFGPGVLLHFRTWSIIAEHCRTLKVLDVAGTKGLIGFPEMELICRQCPKLRELNVSGIDSASCTVDASVDVKACVRMNAWHIYPHSAAQRHTRSPPSLSMGMQPRDIFGRALLIRPSRVIASLCRSKMKKMHLRGCGITDQCIIMIAKSWGKSLEYLDIRNNPIGDISIETLVEALKGMSELRQLIIDGAWVDKESELMSISPGDDARDTDARKLDVLSTLLNASINNRFVIYMDATPAMSHGN